MYISNQYRNFTVLIAFSALAISACSSHRTGFPTCYGDASGCTETHDAGNIFYETQKFQNNQTYGGPNFAPNVKCSQSRRHKKNMCHQIQGVNWVAIPTYHYVFVEDLRPTPPVIIPPTVTSTPVITPEPYIAPTPSLEPMPYIPPSTYPSIDPIPAQTYLPVRK